MAVAFVGSVLLVCLLVYGRGDPCNLAADACWSSLGRADDIYAMFIMCFGQALSVPLSGCVLSIVATRIIHAAFCLGVFGVLGLAPQGRGFVTAC